MTKDGGAPPDESGQHAALLRRGSMSDAPSSAEVATSRTNNSRLPTVNVRASEPGVPRWALALGAVAVAVLLPTAVLLAGLASSGERLHVAKGTAPVASRVVGLARIHRPPAKQVNAR